MKLSKVLEELSKGNSIKFSKNGKPVFQFQKRDKFEIITFTYFGKRNVKNLKKNIYNCSKYITLDKKGLQTLGMSKKDRTEIIENASEKKKFEIKVFKRPIRVSNGAKPINSNLEKYFNDNEFSYVPEFKTYRIRIRSIADYVSIENNEVIVYEVKSDVDSFVRLEKQVKDYLKYADKVFIVLHEKKLKSFLKDYSHLLEKCGLIIFKENNLEFVEVAPVNNPKSHFSLLLSKEELSVMRKFKGYTKIKDKKEFLKETFTKEERQKIVSNILSDRFNKRRNKIYTEGVLTLDISNGVLND